MTINKEGYRIIAVTISLAAAIVALCFWLFPLWAGWTVAALCAALVAFVTIFFREPRRPVLSDEGIVYAPADGKVVVVEEVYEREYLDRPCIQVSVFMSLTNVHVNWYPVGGRILYYKYHPGRFFVAWHPKSSELNERTTTVVESAGRPVLFRQIAGFVARRIVSYARPGERAVQNTKCGFIKFGSRVDVLLPPDSEILVGLGQKVTGSQTPIARLRPKV